MVYLNPMYLRFPLILLIIAGLAGCATVKGASVDKDELSAYEKELAVKSYEHKLQKVARVTQLGYQLVKNLPADDVKVDSRPYLGLFCLNQEPVINQFHGIKAQEGVVVIFVLPDSPVARAGINPGDLVTALNDEPIKDVKKLEHYIDKLPLDQPVHLTVIKDEKEHTIKLMPEKIPLDVRFLVIDDNRVNAGATYNMVVITYGLLNFANSDEEIAAVLSHELAHIARGHVQRNVGGVILREGIAAGLGVTAGILVPGIGAAVQVGVSQIGGLFTKGYTRNLEREADYFGLKLMYHSDWNPDSAINFYERFAIEIPGSMTKGYFKTHPPTSERSLRMRKTLEAIQSGKSFEEFEETL